MKESTSSYLQITLFVILLMIFCTLLIQINKKPINNNKLNNRNKNITAKESFQNNNNKTNKNDSDEFSIIYHSRPEDIIWEIKNININNKYLNVFTIKPLNSNDIIYKPLGQSVYVSDKPLEEDFKMKVKDNIELNLCANKSFTSFNKIWDTNNLSDYKDRPFSIYLGVNTNGLQPVSYILKNGLDNPPSINEFSPVPLIYIDFINDNKNHPIILHHKNKNNRMDLFLKKIDTKYIHYRGFEYENIKIPLLKKNFLENNFNSSEDVIKLTLETNKYQDI